MRMGWLRVELLIPMSHSLKEKRRPLKSIIEKIRTRFHLSAAEVDHQELHQRAAIGIALVAADGHSLAGQMQSVKEFVMNNPDCQVLDIREQTLGWRQE